MVLGIGCVIYIWLCSCVLVNANAFMMTIMGFCMLFSVFLCHQPASYYR